jgi:hypothetical protein
MVSGATRHECRAALAANPGCWRAWPIGACVTLILTGILTVAVAVGAGDIPSAATDDDDKPNMLRAGSAVISSPLLASRRDRLRYADLGFLRPADGLDRVMTRVMPCR